MGQSLNLVDQASAIEDRLSTMLDIPGPDTYELIADRLELTHRQCAANPSIEGSSIPTCRTEAIDFILGSGQKGRTYLIERSGSLYQSPLGWYANRGWDLSPGYLPEANPGFGRRIDNTCLYCHAGRVNKISETAYKSPVFHEASIGCERCHGPGEEHVNTFRQKREQLSASDENSIINPGKLPHAEREDVCNQCHLQADFVIRRFGRNFFDFRPGDRMEDVFVVLSKKRRSSKDNSSAVSHVEQMRESQCYLNSDGRLGCISCHDPHRAPGPVERISLYREKCIACHDQAACSLPLAEREVEPYGNSCFACHMPQSNTSDIPHTAQTDHRIIRNATNIENGVDVGSAKDLNIEFSVFDGAEERLPDWEVRRAKGIALMAMAWREQDAIKARDARRLLMPTTDAGVLPTVIVRSLGKDITALTEIGASYWISSPKGMARPYWERALEIDPANEDALGGLVLLEEEAGNMQQTKIYLKKLTQLAPGESQWWLRLGQLLWRMNERKNAITHIRKSLELSPGQVEIREWLRSIEGEL